METNNLTTPIAVEKDRNTLTIELMNRMKLHGMAAAFTESLSSTMAETMTIDSFLHMLLAREWDYRANAAIQRLIRGAAFAVGPASGRENVEQLVRVALDERFAVTFGEKARVAKEENVGVGAGDVR